jgi:hypothetical protein
LQVQLESARQSVSPVDEFYTTGLSVDVGRLAAQEQLVTAWLELADTQFTKRSDYFKLLRGVGTFGEESLREGFQPCPEPQVT